MSIKKVIEAINQNKTFLITSHLSLEGDAIGSELALAYLLKQKHKDVAIVNEDGVPKNYYFLGGRRLIRSINSLSFEGQNKMKKPEVVFILDCSDLSRCGRAAKIIPKQALLVSIDHHISNRRFADINWVEPKSSSTGEMIYMLYKTMNIPFTYKSALCLYTALLTDTGSFRYSTTGSQTHEATAELIKFNISADKVYQNIYESDSYSDVLVLREALDSLKVDKSGKIAWFRVNRYFADVYSDQSDNVLDFARRIKNIEVCFLLKKSKDKVRVNLRSRGKIDVNKIAKSFGGGGHKNASGCTVNGTLASVEKKVLARIRKAI